MKVFEEAVASLPGQCQRVFVMKKVYGFSHQEISKKLGISISTTEKHVVAGLKRCNEFLTRKAESDQDEEKIVPLKNREARTSIDDRN